MMDTRAFIRLTRLEHALMLCVAVLIGEVIALGRLPELHLILLSFFPPFFIEIAAFAINDFFDVETDKLNKRSDRPLVSGEATTGEALAISAASFAIGIISAYFLGLQAFAITVFFAAFAFLYSYKLKDLPLIGNIYIATTMAIPFIFGNIAVSPTVSASTTLLAAIAFISGLGRELIKTVQDVEGDRAARRACTLPMVIGKPPSLLFASALLVVAVLLSAVPALSISTYSNSLAYLLPVSIADMLLLYVSLTALGGSAESLKKARKITLLALAFGLAGFLLGAFY